MPPRSPDAPVLTSARVAGVGYLIIIVTGIFAEFFVRSRLIVAGDATATAHNIVASESLYRLGLAGEFVMLASDVLVALALYVVFRSVSRNLALLAAFFRLTQASILGVNLLNAYAPLLLLGNAQYLGVFDAPQLHALALFFLKAHSYGYAVGLVFFGLHCLILGALVLKSRYVPGALGMLLLIAGVGYLVDTFGRTMLSNYAQYETIFAVAVFAPAFIAELSFSLWLVVKGVNLRTQQAPA